VTRLRAFDWVLIVALTGVWAVLFARGIGEGLRTQRGFIDVRVSSAHGGEYPTIQDGPTFLAPLQAGDRVMAVDGDDLRGGTQLDFYDRATRGARERGYATLRAERDGAPFEVRVGLAPREGWWLSFAMQVVGMGVALAILWQASDRRIARLLFVSLWLWIALHAVMDFQQGWRGTRTEVIEASSLLVVFAGVAVWTSQELAPSARLVPLGWRALAVASALGFATVVLIRTSMPHTFRQGVTLTTCATSFFIVATLAGLSRAYWRGSALERRRLRWVVLGYYMSFVGNFAAIQLSFVNARLTARVLGALATTGLYLGFLVALVGYRWLDVDRVISATVSYSILGLALLGGALALIPSVAAQSAALGFEPAAAQWLLTLGLVGAAVPLHQYLRPQLERRLFPDRHRRVSGLERLREELGSCSNADELWALASERLDALLEPQSLAVHARDQGQFAVRFSRSGASAPAYDADSMLVRALERRGRPLATDAKELDPFDRAALETLGVSMIVPIHAGERLIAFASLGPKVSGDLYTAEEKKQLGALAARCGELLGEGRESRDERSAQIFRRDGELWTIASGGKQIHLRDMRGLHYLATLLREPRREFAALDLARAANGAPSAQAALPASELHVARRLGDAGPVLDAQARSEYRARIAELERELADAERCADLGRLERASEEREALLVELGAASRGAAPGSDAERARVAVTKAIKTALDKIAEAHPELGAHLATTVRRGYVCAYEPDPRAPSDWEV